MQFSDFFIISLIVTILTYVLLRVENFSKKIAFTGMWAALSASSFSYGIFGIGKLPTHEVWSHMIYALIAAWWAYSEYKFNRPKWWFWAELFAVLGATYLIEQVIFA